MANALKKLVEDEIKSLDEMMGRHAFHQIVLKDLLSKMDMSTGKVAPTKPSTERTSDLPNNKRDRSNMAIAEIVANYVRQSGATKSGAVRHLLNSKELPEHAGTLSTVMSKIKPSSLGKRNHARIFSGTSHAK